MNFYLSIHDTLTLDDYVLEADKNMFVVSNTLHRGKVHYIINDKDKMACCYTLLKNLKPEPFTQQDNRDVDAPKIAHTYGH